MTMTQATATRSDRAQAATSSRLGPLAFLVSGAVALVVTAAAATVAPHLAKTGTGGYAVSGVLMTVSDLALLVGVVLLGRTDAVRRGRLHTIGFGLAIAGSAAAVPAEVLLRVNHDAGNAAFGVVGPIQALGLILVGAGVLVTRTWTGWRRYVTLALGVYIPVILIPSLAASGGENLPALAGYHLLVLALGAAYWRESRRGNQSR